MAAARVLLALLAVSSLVLSALAWPWSLALSALVLISSGWRIRRELRLEAVSLRLADDGAWVVLLQDRARPILLRAAEIGVRGPLAWVRARDDSGRLRSWMWWPDSLEAEGMRKLRLACAGRRAKSAPSLATMQG